MRTVRTHTLPPALCLQDDPSTGVRVTPENLFTTFQKLTDQNFRVRRTFVQRCLGSCTCEPLCQGLRTYTLALLCLGLSACMTRVAEGRTFHTLLFLLLTQDHWNALYTFLADWHKNWHNRLMGVCALLMRTLCTTLLACFAALTKATSDLLCCAWHITTAW